MKPSSKTPISSPKPLQQASVDYTAPPNYLGKTADTLKLENKFYSFRLINTTTSGRPVVITIYILIILGIVSLFLPWQQNIRGTGMVTALLPSERPQVVPNTIGGMIEEWYIKEGDYVSKGQPICRIKEVKDKFFDPKTADRLSEQVNAKVAGIDNLSAKANALGDQIHALEEGLTFSLQKAKNKVEQNKNKVTSDSAEYVASQLDYKIELLRLERQQELYSKGLVSLTKLESHKLKTQETQAKQTEKENKLNVSKQELDNSIIELNSITADYQSKIAKASSDQNETVYKLNDTRASISKLQNERSNVEIRNGYYIVRAPQDGYVVKSVKEGIGEMIKEGEAIVTIMPKNHTPAVELYVYANDVPLLSKGRKVRLEFDGWPALQVTGWPSVAVGTFGGVVHVIDYVNSKDGKYRVLVVQDPELIAQDKEKNQWPTQLRIGSGVYGWAMLDEVPVWFEIWRQLNGFPPSLESKPKDPKHDLEIKLKLK
jgi:multidrug resistance efflux pump